MDRKQLTDLTTSDLLENKVWEYWMSEKTEYVKASDKTDISEDSNVTYIVVTDFIFNNKTKHIGFCSPQASGKLDQIQPVILTKKGQVEFYKDTEWTENEKNKALLKLGYDLNDVFPVAYKTRVKSDLKFYDGTLVDFNEGE